jgi:hypothetical protein
MEGASGREVHLLVRLSYLRPLHYFLLFGQYRQWSLPHQNQIARTDWTRSFLGYGDSDHGSIAPRTSQVSFLHKTTLRAQAAFPRSHRFCDLPSHRQ